MLNSQLSTEDIRAGDWGGGLSEMWENETEKKNRNLRVLKGETGPVGLRTNIAGGWFMP